MIDHTVKNTRFSLRFYDILFVLGILSFAAGVALYFFTDMKIRGIFIGTAGIITANLSRKAFLRYTKDAQDLGIDYIP
jgi:uncharacterized membrane protein